MLIDTLRLSFRRENPIDQLLSFASARHWDQPYSFRSAFTILLHKQIT